MILKYLNLFLFLFNLLFSQWTIIIFHVRRSIGVGCFINYNFEGQEFVVFVSFSGFSVIIFTFAICTIILLVLHFILDFCVYKLSLCIQSNKSSALFMSRRGNSASSFGWFFFHPYIFHS